MERACQSPEHTHRPRHLLSGLLEYGACSGPYAIRGPDRYGGSNRLMNGGCSNGRGIRRAVLEERVLVGLTDRLIAPLMGMSFSGYRK